RRAGANQRSSPTLAGKRHGNHQRREVLYCLVAPRPCQHRSRIRRPGGSQPHPSILGQHSQTPPQPRRRSRLEQCLTPCCSQQNGTRSRDPRLRRKTNKRRQNEKRNPTLPQTLHRPPSIQNPQHPTTRHATCLTDIEESWSFVTGRTRRCTVPCR